MTKTKQKIQNHPNSKVTKILQMFQLYQDNKIYQTIQNSLQLD